MNNPDPLPPRVGCEHPAFTAVFDKLLSEVPPIQAPPLEMARRRLEPLQAKHDTILAEAIENGTEGELDYVPDWKFFCHELESARAEVRRLESEAIQ